jgi:hypothetical protein
LNNFSNCTGTNTDGVELPFLNVNRFLAARFWYVSCCDILCFAYVRAGAESIFPIENFLEISLRPNGARFNLLRPKWQVSGRARRSSSRQLLKSENHRNAGAVIE